MTPFPHHARWQAVCTRDPSAHSSFIYAVTTTRIYCRPTCPARLARRANVVFFDAPDAAAAAGFRACKRCKPESSTAALQGRQREAVRQACEILRQVQGVARLQDVAKQVGLSPRYFHGIFKDAMDMTPAQYARDCRGSEMKNSDCVSSSATPLSLSSTCTTNTTTNIGSLCGGGANVLTITNVERGLPETEPESSDPAIDAILGTLLTDEITMMMDGEMDFAVSRDPFDDAAAPSLLEALDPVSVNTEAYLDPCFGYSYLEI